MDIGSNKARHLRSLACYILIGISQAGAEVCATALAKTWVAVSWHITARAVTRLSFSSTVHEVDVQRGKLRCMLCFTCLAVKQNVLICCAWQRHICTHSVVLKPFFSLNPSVFPGTTEIVSRWPVRRCNSLCPALARVSDDMATTRINITSLMFTLAV